MMSEFREEAQAVLLTARAEWDRRLEAIQADRRRVSAPPPKPVYHA